MHLGIYDTSLGGHHAAYIKAIASEALKRRWKLTIILPKTERGHSASLKLEREIGTSNFFYAPFETPKRLWDGTKISWVHYHFAQYRLARRCLADAGSRCDFLYAPTMDKLDKLTRMIGPPTREVPMGGMCMRVRFHLDPVDSPTALARIQFHLRERWFNRLLNSPSIKLIATTDPTLYEYCQRKGAVMSKVRYAPEIGMDPPSIPRGEARHHLGISEHEKVILLYGALAKRKGLSELLKAITSAKNQAPIRVLAIGEVAPEMKEYVDSPVVKRLVNSGELTILPGFADDQLQSAAFAAADAVWVAYIGHQTMSGVFYQALCSGLPVIAPNYGILRYLTDKHNVGITVDVADPVDTNLRINKLMNDQSAAVNLTANAVALGKLHRPSNFGGAICDAISATA